MRRQNNFRLEVLCLLFYSSSLLLLIQLSEDFLMNIISKLAEMTDFVYKTL
jgi:hypothetical protein